MSLTLLIQKQGINSREFANQMCVTPACVCYWDKRQRQPDISLIPKMAKILNCSIEDIVMCFCDEEVTPA